MTRPATAIALIRHGQTDWNRARRIQGRTDIALNDAGRAQARQATRKLEGFVDPHGSQPHLRHRLVSSPLGRAIETAEIIAETLSLRGPILNTELIERDFGAAEGLAVSEAEKRWPGLTVPDAEPLENLAERSAAVLESILNDSPGAVVVGHGVMLRWGLSQLCAREVPRISNGEVWILTRTSQGSLGLERAQ